MSILFLDFDGVLHDPSHADIRYFEGQMIVTGDRLFSHVPLLASLLQQANRQIDIVISSSWQNHFTLDELKARLGEIAPFVVGATRDLRGGLCANRFEECLSYAQHQGDDDWRMIDDSVDIVFGTAIPDGWQIEHVIFCDSTLGVAGMTTQASLSNWLKDPIRKPAEPASIEAMNPAGK